MKVERFPEAGAFLERLASREGGRTPNGSRIGWVFTPPEWRGRGYASACLYTDLGNATLNALYQRIGYERMCDVIDYRFDAR